MRAHFEEEPEPDEQPEVDEPAAAAAPMVPSVAAGAREFEYRTEPITASEILDGQTLADRLTKASAEGWDLVEIVTADDRHAVLLRRPRQQDREQRPVGFLPPAR
jgi:hypothetical protein